MQRPKILGILFIFNDFISPLSVRNLLFVILTNSVEVPTMTHFTSSTLNTFLLMSRRWRLNATLVSSPVLDLFILVLPDALFPLQQMMLYHYYQYPHQTSIKAKLFVYILYSLYSIISYIIKKVKLSNIGSSSWLALTTLRLHYITKIS